MPASGFDLYNMQDARNNFDAMRPTPICTDANQFMGQCQNIHISTNCYYGYHEQKPLQNIETVPDCEMAEAPRDDAKSPIPNHGRKRSADDGVYHEIKRPRSGEGLLRCVQLKSQQNWTGDFPLMHLWHSVMKSEFISEEVQREKNNEPETNENVKTDRSKEELLETLYWNIHGGNFIDLLQCL